MKRTLPSSPNRGGDFLSQKTIRSFFVTDTVTRPLKEVTLSMLEEAEGSITLTADLRFAMANSVKYQLDVYKMTQVRPLKCAIHISIDNGEEEEEVAEEDYYTVTYEERYFEELCYAFLKMFSSYKRPTHFSEVSGDFLAEDDTFNMAWVTFHQKRAKLRIVCQSCHLSLPHNHQQQAEKKPETTKAKSINDVLVPYRAAAAAFEHPWLDIATWGERSGKGNYTRKLGDNKPFTLYQKNAKWYYVYQKQYAKEGFDSLRAILQHTYTTFNDAIRRYI